MTQRFHFEEPSFQAAVAARVPGWTGHGLRFDGKTQFAEVPSTAAMNPGQGDFSLELWIRTNERNNRNIVDKRDWTPRGYTLFLDMGGFLGFQAADGEQISTVVERGKAINDGQWHHVAAVVKRLPPGPAVLYVDGQRKSVSGRPVPLETLDNTMPMRFARHHKNSVVRRDNIFYSGDIDEFAFYKRALSDAEIKSIFAAGRAGKCR